MPRLDRETLRQRMEKHLDTGEALLAWGWAATGFRNVLVAATDRRLILDTIGLGLRTRDIESLEYSRLEVMAAGPGDSTLPGWAKINIENAIMDAVTTHLAVKPLGGPIRHYLFRPYPFYGENKAAGLEIGQAIVSIRPSMPGDEALARIKGESKGRVVWSRWGVVAGAASGIFLAIVTRSWGGAVAGAFAGFLLGAVAAIAWNAIRTMASGRG
jgi:hypothetical protein